jgi:hypothetical protein
MGERMGLDSGEAVVSTSAVRSLNDRLYILETALADVERDLREGGDHRAAFTHLYTAAAALAGESLEPSAILDA